MRWNQQWYWRLKAIIFVLLAGVTIENRSSLAQIVPDITLGNENSVVTPNVNVKDSPASLIEGGAERGVNLFHSFSEFNIGDLERVYFANPTGIERIFSRVTGNKVSNIEGLLGVVGNADLFFLNPNGIILGENGSLDVNGSFIGSTADSLVFGDEFVFSASNPTDVLPLLTVNIVPGLQYGNNPGAITNFSIANEVGLQVPADETIALVGGDIEVNGGVILALGGRIELGSVGENILVQIDAVSNSYSFNYDNVEQFQDINLNSAFLNLDGEQKGGALQVVAKNITLRQASMINSETFGDLSGETLSLQATDSIQLSDNSFILSRVRSQATGNGSNIAINTKFLKLNNGSEIAAETFGIGNSGNIEIAALEVELKVISTSNPQPNRIYSQAEGGIGNAGNLTLNTENLRIADDSQISTSTVSQGNGGLLTIKAIYIELTGFFASNPNPTGLFSQALPNSTGDAGNINITTTNLKLTDTATISSQEE